MPFELGMDSGCRRYGGDALSRKVILILAEHPYRYQAAISDLAGSDVKSHGAEYATAVRKVRNWLTEVGDFEHVGAARILAEYEDFQEWHHERQLAARRLGPRVS